MTKREALIVSAYTGFLLTKDIADYHSFCQETLGRQIWTDEFATESLHDELRKKLKPQIIKIIESETEDNEVL